LATFKVSMLVGGLQLSANCMEYVVVVNDDDEEIGTTPRVDAHRDGTPHRIAVTYVESADGEVLVQIRARSGAHDHSSAGHVNPGDSYLDTAKRELAEELGINDVDLHWIGHDVSQNQHSDDGTIKTHVFDVFVCTANAGTLQESEVSGVYWANPYEILRDMNSGDGTIAYAGGFRASLPVYLKFRSERQLMSK
jgi:isopentenyl-diphosphate Delta-isomerase